MLFFVFGEGGLRKRLMVKRRDDLRDENFLLEDGILKFLNGLFLEFVLLIELLVFG